MMNPNKNSKDVQSAPQQGANPRDAQQNLVNSIAQEPRFTVQIPPVQPSPPQPAPPRQPAPQPAQPAPPRQSAPPPRQSAAPPPAQSSAPPPARSSAPPARPPENREAP